MSSQPRRNEDRFYRYPMHRVVAIVDDESQLAVALSGLEDAGFDVTTVNVLSDDEGVRLLDRTGVRHGVRGRVLRLLQRGAYEVDALRDHEQALKAGHLVVYVPARDSEEADRVAGILRGAGGRLIRYFRRWSVERPRL